MEFFTKEEIERIIDQVIDLYLIPNFHNLGMPATNEWEANVEARGNEIWGREYTEYLAGGRPPNKDQGQIALRNWAVWAGNTFIKDWAQAKGVPIDPIAIAYKIARDGTTWYPDGSDILEVLESREVLEFITNELTKITVEKIKTQFKNEFNRA